MMTIKSEDTQTIEKGSKDSEAMMQKSPDKTKEKESTPNGSPELRQMLKDRYLRLRDLAEAKKAQGITTSTPDGQNPE